MTALATLETRREMEPKCVTHLFLRSVMGTCLSAIGQAPVVQKLNSAIQRINPYPVFKYKGNQLHYPLDRDLSTG